MAKIPVDHYIHIPYKDGGRDRFGIDCYGLVLLVEREVFGVWLADVRYLSSQDFKNNTNLVDETRATLEATPITQPREGDLVLMRYGDNPCHVGVFVEPGSVLHTVAVYGTVCQRIDSAMIRHRIVGYYRV